MSGLFRQSFDDLNNAQEVELLGGTDQTKIGNSGDKLKVDNSGVTQPISAASLPLPSGAATESTLSILNGKIPSNLTVTGTRLLIDGSGVTQPVSGTVNSAQSGTWNITNVSGTVSLPTGASTATLQTSGNSSLSSIDTKTPALGQALAAASVPVVLTAAQLSTLTPLSTITTNQGTSPWVVNMTQVGSSNITLGQKTSANSLPIVISSDQPVFTVQTVPLDGTRLTYSAAVSGFATALLATDVFVISGSASKTIRLTQVHISGTTSSGSGISSNISFIKRSAANTGGTSVSLTNVPHDSANTAGTAAVKYYTANPLTLGTAVGSVRTYRYNFTNASVSNPFLNWEFGNRPSQGLVLRGVAESLAINFGATTITGASISIMIEWTEE